MAETLAKFDPFQVFEVEHRPCLILHVRVLTGRDISGSWIIDYVKSPSPYMLMKVRTAPLGVKRTKYAAYNRNPVWDEEFSFYLDARRDNMLDLYLMDAHYLGDECLGGLRYNINELGINNTVKKTVCYKRGEVEVELMIQFNNDPDLRYSLCLCDEEKAFLRKRRKKILKSMQRLLETDKGPVNEDEVPVVGVMGSGGGFRAMVGFAGAFKALDASKILSCATYAAGLSGSCMYLGQLYSHPDFPKKSPGELVDELRNNVQYGTLWTLSPGRSYRYLREMWQKRCQGQCVSLPDLAGHMLATGLLNGRHDAKLTDQQKALESANVPLPLYTCVNVKHDVAAQNFQEWMDMSPYEVGFPKYGIFMKPDLFGSKFFLGKLVHKCGECPLHYLMGLWGSAYGILFRRLLGEPKESPDTELEKELASHDDDENDDDSWDYPLWDMDKNQTPEPVQKPPQPSPGLRARLAQWLFTSKRMPWLSGRSGRAGVIHNPLRGLCLDKVFSISPFEPRQIYRSVDEFEGNFDMQETGAKMLVLTDAGLAFNSPYPLLLRPQRKVDIILSFDFSWRGESDHPLDELLMAEKWARINRVPFPPIDASVCDVEDLKEMYIFKHPTDPHCPVIFHFPLVNRLFRKFKQPGVPRATPEEMQFGDFELLADEYATFNFSYSDQTSDRLVKLFEFNTLLHVDDIKAAIEECVVRKRAHGTKWPSLQQMMGVLRRNSVARRQSMAVEMNAMELEVKRMSLVSSHHERFMSIVDSYPDDGEWVDALPSPESSGRSSLASTTSSRRLGSYPAVQEEDEEEVEEQEQELKQDQEQEQEQEKGEED